MTETTGGWRGAPREPPLPTLVQGWGVGPRFPVFPCGLRSGKPCNRTKQAFVTNIFFGATVSRATIRRLTQRQLEPRSRLLTRRPSCQYAKTPDRGTIRRIGIQALKLPVPPKIQPRLSITQSAPGIARERLCEAILHGPALVSVMAVTHQDDSEGIWNAAD